MHDFDDRRCTRPGPPSWPWAVMLLAPALACATAWAAQSPYAGEQGRAIAALSSEEVDGLLAGKGMGLARAAELNGYPGPMHVLELAGPLGLTAAQRASTEAIFARMRDAAKSVGAAIVAAEQELDALFRTRTVDAAALSGAVGRIATLRGELRALHLAAHLDQARVLSETQIERYAELRGYRDGSHGHRHRDH